MNNKIMLGVLVVFIFLAVSANAKPKEQSQQQFGAGDIVALMKKQLELTDKQIEEVKPIIENYLTKEKQLRLEEKKQLSKVLTSDQMYAWNFLQNEKPREKKKR